ncbi:MAG: hypothetical protein R3F37_18005 [Candidatus Competibacteraceae bacterium]
MKKYPALLASLAAAALPLSAAQADSLLFPYVVTSDTVASIISVVNKDQSNELFQLLHQGQPGQYGQLYRPTAPAVYFQLQRFGVLRSQWYLAGRCRFGERRALVQRLPPEPPLTAGSISPWGR